MYTMGIVDKMLPAMNTRYSGKISHRTPKITEDNANPPVDAALTKPRMLPRFSSGNASIMDALKNAVAQGIAQTAQEEHDTHKKIALGKIRHHI